MFCTDFRLFLSRPFLSLKSICLLTTEEHFHCSWTCRSGYVSCPSCWCTDTEHLRQPRASLWERPRLRRSRTISDSHSRGLNVNRSRTLEWVFTDLLIQEWGSPHHLWSHVSGRGRSSVLSRHHGKCEVPEDPRWTPTRRRLWWGNNGGKDGLGQREWGKETSREVVTYWTCS